MAFLDRHLAGPPMALSRHHSLPPLISALLTLNSFMGWHVSAFRFVGQFWPLLLWDGASLLAGWPVAVAQNQCYVFHANYTTVTIIEKINFSIPVSESNFWDCYSETFADHMPFLMTNQQCPSTESNVSVGNGLEVYVCLYTIWWCPILVE